ncbi:MAG: hypothetical protein ACI9RZ_001587 [Sphingobacteriales bacterium]|jgi:hypothetical protein
MHHGKRQSVHRMRPTSYAFVVMVSASWRSNKTTIKFMINAFKGKIETHKSLVMIIE